jgi:hypothetical protein
LDTSRDVITHKRGEASVPGSLFVDPVVGLVDDCLDWQLEELSHELGSAAVALAFEVDAPLPWHDKCGYKLASSVHVGGRNQDGGKEKVWVLCLVHKGVNHDVCHPD